MCDSVTLQDAPVAVALKVAICTALVVIVFVVSRWYFYSSWASACRAVQLLTQLMLSRQGREHTKLHHAVFSPEVYPGTLPSAADHQKAGEFRQKGNIAFNEGRYEKAKIAYSHAVLLNPSDHLSYSSRSACWLRMGQAMPAWDDAELCVRLAPSFAKGYLRKGAAEVLLNRRVDAEASYKRGLSLDCENILLQHSLRELRMDGKVGVQATLHHVLFVSPHLQMDRLFQVLEDPDRLTASYVEKHKNMLDAQFECLTQTLHADLSLLVASPVLRDAYDRVTFACGQLIQWAPELATKHLASAHRIVAGLGLALRCGWSIHHGVAKFAANALTVLATSEGAADCLRREAVRLLLGGMLGWISDPSPEPEHPQEDRDVCGCTFLSPRLSAATWLERLFEHGTKAWVREECESFPDILLLTVHLCLIVRDERAAPLGLPCLLRLPKVAKAIMDSDMIIDLSTCNKDPTGRKDGKRWVNRQKGIGFAPIAPTISSTVVIEFPAAGPLASGGDLSMQGTTPRCDARSRSVAGDSEVTEEISRDDEAVGKLLSRDHVPSTPNIETDVDWHGGQQVSLRLTAPSQRLGEWVMTSLGYLLVCIDDDALFAAHACSALYHLAIVVPGGVARLTGGLWVGLPLLERLSSLACHHSVALQLLEVLARHSHSSRIAMRSLAEALAGVQTRIRAPHQSFPFDFRGEPAARGGGSSPSFQNSPSNMLPVSGLGETATELNEIEIMIQGREIGELIEDSSDPSWVEYFHELCDELWVEGQPQSEDCSIPGEACAARSITEPQTIDCASHFRIAPGVTTQSLMSLGNFDATAVQVPITARITFSNATDSDLRYGASSLAAGFPQDVMAVPAIWNSRFADNITGNLVVDIDNLIDSPFWRVGKSGAVVALLRSSIQRSIATPDLAAAVWLCHDAGALAVIVINDFLDDDPSQPAFRMGLFGSPPPPIAAFMISGQNAMAFLGIEAPGPEVTVQSIRWIATHAEFEGLTEAVPPWPLVPRTLEDVAQSWSLLETVQRAAPSPALAKRLAALAARMCLPEKRVWLMRRLQRVHRGDTYIDEPEETSLAFVECERHGDQLVQLRRHLVEGIGICAPDIAGEFEVRFKDESSVGSAVMREWMDILAQQAFLPAVHRLLVSHDHGKTFMPDLSAPFLNRCWAGDFELLGRLLGLALWHQVTLDLPLHPYIFQLLLHFDKEFESGERDVVEDIATLSTIDADLAKNKVQWLLSNNISTLGYDMPFADFLCSREQGAPEPDVDIALQKLAEEVRPCDALLGNEHVCEPLRLRAFDYSQVLLARDGEDCMVTETNKMEFVKRLLQWRLRDSLYLPVSAILRGIHAAVPAEVLAEARQMLTAEELCALLAGSRDIHVDNWEMNTSMTGGLSTSHKEVGWFWQTLRQWESQGRQELLQSFLQFATGSRRVPVGGFAQLVGFNGGKHLFTLAKGVRLSASSLPTSHACICTVDLPPWESFEFASQKLLAAAEAGNARFDESLGHDE